MWKKQKEVFLTSDIGIAGLVKRELERKNIRYKIKTVNSGVLNRSSGTLAGRLGVNTASEVMYYFYVNPDDTYKAKYIIDEVLKNRP